ncbi:hypothetical protein [Egbenema bharatensis]
MLFYCFDRSYCNHPDRLWSILPISESNAVTCGSLADKLGKKSLSDRP